MKKSRFINSQIIDALKRSGNGLSMPNLSRELSISSAIFYNWCSKYGGLDVSIRLAGKAIRICQKCYRYVSKRNAKNKQIAHWLLKLTYNNRNWGFGQCFPYLRM